MANIVGIPGNIMSFVGRVLKPAATQINDGQPTEISLSRHGAIHVSPNTGPAYPMCAAGAVFTASANDGTGRTILAGGGTTSGFMFYNPVGSGVIMDILELLTLPLTATDVVGVLGLEYGAPPTTVANAATVRSSAPSGPNVTAQCKASYGSTIVAMTWLRNLPVFVQTTAGVLQGSNGLYKPEGSLLLYGMW